jgi:hypothetical protein
VAVCIGWVSGCQLIGRSQAFGRQRLRRNDQRAVTLALLTMPGTQPRL